MNHLPIASIALIALSSSALWGQSPEGPSPKDQAPQSQAEDRDPKSQAPAGREAPENYKPAASSSDRPASVGGTPETVSREQRLADYLSGIKFVGQFTIDGKDSPPKTEEYVITKCEKLAEPEMYRLTARIIYGDIDTEIPLDVPILWSGRTPVISLDNFWIPAMGTFDARVLIHGDRYAGTWQHDQVGGHMFGKLVKLSEAEKEAPTKTTEEEPDDSDEDAQP